MGRQAGDRFPTDNVASGHWRGYHRRLPTSPRAISASSQFARSLHVSKTASTPSQPLLDRRQMLQATVVSTASLATASAVAAPNDRLQVGVIGLGSRGYNLIDALLAEPDAQIVAVCDVDEIHYRDRPWGTGRVYGRTAGKQHVVDGYAKRRRQSSGGSGASDVAVYSDYRELCAHAGLDAVVVATPDHWHAQCTIHAIDQGLDVYCEKPVTHTFAEGLQVIAAAKRAKAIVQVGSQQRSTPNFRTAVEIVRHGHFGKVLQVEVGLPPGYEQPMGDPSIVTPPQSLDYDFWCGPAPKLPYMRARHHRWWRGHRAFGGGVLMDWIGHHNDIAHWATGMDGKGPLSVEAVGWTAAKTDVYNSPHQYTIRCEYPGGIQWSISSQHTVGAKIIGEQGWLFVARGKLEASNPQWTAKFDPTSNAPLPSIEPAYESPGHMRNFLDGVRTRKSCICPPEVAHCSITPGHLGYVSHEVGRKLVWDAKRQQVVDDKDADALLRKNDYRKPWTS